MQLPFLSFVYLTHGDVPDMNSATVLLTSSGSILQLRKAKGFLAVALQSCLAIALIITFTLSIASAQVSLPQVNLGRTSFEDGIAFPGWMIETLPQYYRANSWKSSDGTSIPGSNTLTSMSALNHVALITNHRVLGGDVGGEVLLVLADVTPQTTFGPDSRTSGSSDFTFGPLLQWTNTKIAGKPFFQRACFDVSVPTGKYRSTRQVNIGNNDVVFNPYYAFTFVPSPRWEVSARLHYLFSSENDSPATGDPTIHSIQAGQAFHQNYAASYKLHEGIRLGFNGYALEQITDHRMNGNAISGSRERVVGLGPGMEFGGKGVWLWVNSYIETAAQNRPQGVAVSFDLRKALPLRHEHQ